MFRQIRFQTGEIDEIISEMEKGNVPCMDVDDVDEFNWFLTRLAAKGISRVESIPPDKNARDRLKEPEFEFRAAFRSAKSDRIMYMDFYFEPDEEESYDAIFGD